MKTKFTNEQNKILTEIFRRLNYFQAGDLNTNLLYLAFPSGAKVIKEFNLTSPCINEIPRVLGWYRLTETGKSFFANYEIKNKISDDMNLAMFTGEYVKTFDFYLLKK